MNNEFFAPNNKLDPRLPDDHCQEFLTDKQEERLRDYYFDEENEVEDKLTEQGFIDWKEDLSWGEIYDIVGYPHDDHFEDRYDEDE